MGQAQKGDVRIGQLIAKKYRIEQLLGEGGVGLVYRAQNTMLGREVAIKVLRPEFVQNEDLLGRFMREARAANLVRHPNVVDVLDVGLDDDGNPYIVQELLKGEDLAQLLERTEGSRLPVEKVIALMLPVIDAVAFAHAMGVVHRDLKPDNVYLARIDGGVVPKILDFGISKIAAGLTENVRITSTGISMGTPAYMSPEQIQRFGDIDARTDVWALGVMVYELVAGCLPFEGETSGAMFVSICSRDPIPLKRVVPDASDDLVRVIGRCLRREVDERYPTAAELARDLRNLAEGRAVEPTKRIALVSLPPPPPVDATRAATAMASVGATAPVEVRAGVDETSRQRRVSAQTTQPESPEPAPNATAEMRAAAPPPSRLRLFAAAGAALALAGVVVGLAATRGASTRPTANPPLATVSAHSVGDPAAAPSRPLLIESSPGGAEVREDGRLLGLTPLTVTVDGARARRFVITAPGRAPYVLEHAAANTQERVMATLLVPSALAAATTTTGTDPATATPAGTGNTTAASPTIAATTTTTTTSPRGGRSGSRNGRGRGNAGSSTTAAHATAHAPTATHAPLEIRTER